MLVYATAIEDRMKTRIHKKREEGRDRKRENKFNNKFMLQFDYVWICFAGTAIETRKLKMEMKINDIEMSINFDYTL